MRARIHGDGVDAVMALTRGSVSRMRAHVHERLPKRDGLVERRRNEEKDYEKHSTTICRNALDRALADRRASHRRGEGSRAARQSQRAHELCSDRSAVGAIARFSLVIAPIQRSVLKQRPQLRAPSTARSGKRRRRLVFVIWGISKGF